MKKLTPKNLIAIVLIAVVMTQLGSCKRNVWEPEVSVPSCRIKKIIDKKGGIDNRGGEIFYNAYGDPVEFIPVIYTTGSVKYEFRYDDKRRLTDFIGFYPPRNGLEGFFEIWRKYIYDDNGRIIRDTAYHYGPYGPTITKYGNFKTVTKYDYDKEGRVSRLLWQQYIDDKINPGIMGDYKYLYNDQGNLITPGAVYDDKVNIYSLHKVWMFLNCNYSKNNVQKGTSYNDHGLPLGFPPRTQQGANLGMMYWVGLNNADIEYECK